jgi:hypothetical protein
MVERGVGVGTTRMDIEGGAHPCVTTRVFSSRYVLMCAPESCPERSNCSMRNLPYRDELLFIVVFALPNASRSGLDAMTRASMLSSPEEDLDAQNAKCCRTFFAVSDLPAPDSPEMTMDCAITVRAREYSEKGVMAGHPPSWELSQELPQSRGSFHLRRATANLRTQPKEAVISSSSGSVNVRRKRAQRCSFILHHVLGRVDWESLIWVHGNE